MEITKEFIELKYIKEKKSLREIGKIIERSPKQVSVYLKKFGIKARPFSTKGLKPRQGAVLSDKTKNKIRKSHIGKKLSPEHRLKVIKTLNHGKGSKNPNWNGGKILTDNGYILVRVEDKYIKEHRLVVEKNIGRKLNKEEIIHHINGNRKDNRIENLEITNQVDHSNNHWKDEEKRKMQSDFMREQRKNKFWSTKKNNK